jgi:flagellum-specific peptidoglycan hydrolase FlgJ
MRIIVLVFLVASVTYALTLDKETKCPYLGFFQKIKYEIKKGRLSSVENFSMDSLAPAEIDSVPTYNAEKYIEQYKAIAQQEQKLYRIPASITLAQALIESRAGTSKLAVHNNNHFGLKCFSNFCKRGHCSNFEDDTHKDFFRKFETPEESFRQHSLLLAGARYMLNETSYTKWAYRLQDKGYATDRNYATKLIKTIQRYKLYELD